MFITSETTIGEIPRAIVGHNRLVAMMILNHVTVKPLKINRATSNYLILAYTEQ